MPSPLRNHATGTPHTAIPWIAVNKIKPQPLADRAPHADILERLAPWATVLEMPPHGEVVAQQTDARCCFMVASGCARTVQMLADGRRQVGAFLFPGDLFGWESAGLHKLGVDAVTHVTLHRYARYDLDAVADHNPVIAHWLRQVAARQMRASRDHMFLLGYMTASERMANFLLEIAQQTNADCGARIDLPMSRRDIADYLGLAIETVSRVLTQLDRDGAIAGRRSCFSIRSRQALETAGGRVDWGR